MKAFSKQSVFAIWLCGAVSVPALGAVQLESLWVYDPPGNISHVVPVGDVDGDGLLDVAVWGNGGSGAWVVSSATGLAVLPFLMCPALDPGARDVENVGDWNGDGVEDIGIGFTEAGIGESGEFQIFSGADGSTLTTMGNPFAPLFPFFGVGEPIGDITGDGIVDMVFVWDPSSIFATEELSFVCDGATGEVLFVHRDLFEASACGVWPVALTDLNQDGVPEYALLGEKIGPILQSTSSGDLRVFDGASHQVLYSDAYARAAGAYPAGDVDGDGVPDIVVTATSTNCGTFVFNNNFPARVVSGADLSVLLELQYTRDLDFRYTCQFLEVESGGDFNGDGIPDLVADQPPLGGINGIDSTMALYSGRTGTMLNRMVGKFQSTIVPDSNGDGLDDLVTVDSIADMATLHAGAPGDAFRVCTSTVNSSGSAARISTDGPISVFNNELNFLIEGGVPNEMVTIFCGPELAQLPVGDGFLCVGPGSTGYLRLSTPEMLDGDGLLLHRIDMTQGPLGAAGPFAWEPGARWVVQAQIRDPQGPGGTGFNFTDALDITLTP